MWNHGGAHKSHHLHKHRKGDGSSSHEMDMIHGPLLGKITMFALPLAVSSVLQQVFNMTDAIMAGQLIDAAALAAVGGNAVVVSLFLNLFVGLAVGANAVIARFIGEGNTSRLQNAIHSVMVLALISGVLLVVVGLVSAEWLLVLIDTPSNILVDATLYLRVYFMGMIFIMIYNFGSAVMRSKGDTKRPLYALIVAGVLNVGLNFVLVGWGVAGLAAATALSNGVSAAMVLWWMTHDDAAYRLHFNKLRVHWPSMKAVLAIGVPAGIQGMVFSLSNVCIQGGINSFGSAAVAGSAAAVNAEFVSYFFVSAYVQTAVTFIAQNYAAGDVERCKKVFLICMVSALAVAIFTNALFVIGGDTFLAIFTADAAAISFGWVRLLRVETCQFLVSSYEITAGALRGMGSSMLPAVITILGTCFLRFAWVLFVFPLNHDLYWLLTVYPVTWVVTGIAMVIAYIVVSRRKYAAISGQKTVEVEGE